MHKDLLRGALIGAGAVTPFHLRAWEQVSQASIVAIADPDVAAATRRGDESGISRQHIYPSLEALLEREPRLDFVDIATSPDTHLKLVQMAAERGLQITCQKPFAYSLNEALRMIELCEKAGVVLNINENWRWRTWYREIKSLLERGEIGQVYYAKFFIHAGYWVRLDQKTRLGRRPHGTLMEWGIHHMDLMRYLFGEIESVYARTHPVFSESPEIDQAALVVAVFPSGMTAYLDLSSASYSIDGNVNRDGPMVEHMRIEGHAGAILLHPDLERGDRLEVVTPDQRIDRLAYEGTPQAAYQASYTAAHQHFVDCLLCGESPETSARDNIETLAVVLAAYQSAENNQVIGLEDYKRQNI